jgi:hypothetical protein
MMMTAQYATPSNDNGRNRNNHQQSRQAKTFIDHVTPYTYSEAGAVSSLDDETVALAGRVEDFVDAFMASPLTNMLLDLDPAKANTPEQANALSDQWLAVVLGPTLPKYLPSSNTLI